MVNSFGKSLLVATSLAPICGAFAVNRIGELNYAAFYDLAFWCWLVGAFGLLFLTYLFFAWCKHRLKHTEISTTKIKPTDKDVLAFLLAYLLPLLGKDVLAFEAKPVVSVYVFSLIFISVYHSNSFHFNPMLSFLGYHFYEIECADGMTAMLISKRTHLVHAQQITICRISDYLLLDVSDSSQSPIELLQG